MKTFIIFSLSIIYIATFSQSDLKNLDWLVGSWNRSNAKPGRSGAEIWSKKSNQEFIGRGINLKGVDTTFIERLKIVVQSNKIYYVADVPENKNPVLFELTSQSGSSFTFENPQHDFPKKIVYELVDSKLKATISGDGKAIEYWFEKLN